ncbi:MAG: bifunctional 5,10-methylene-tetrahydrofolate dehydrogenase/5,10-methylene-tetrahydrofolate cyclohydrolase, partial [Marinilabiliales bacterium]
MQLIDGKKISQEIKEEIAKEVDAIKAKGGKTPHLAAILVGNDGGSLTYVGHKVKACEQVGFKSTLIHLEDTCTEDTVMQHIDKLNNDSDVDGFIVQLPLPDHISETKVIEAIKPSKDVDGFHPVNVGRMVANLPAYIPATPMGILELIKRYKIDTEGKNVVVLGRSHIVGTPVSILLSRKGYPGNATVTLCHSRTKNMSEIASSADVLIVALGIP